MDALGERLLALCEGANRELVIAAPFIKAVALARLLAPVSPTVPVVCCTRWIPEEIASGATDIEVWDVLKSRPGSKLYLRPNLHAKYYRADECCFVGSANITAAALGWRPDSNLEILTKVQRSLFIEFEREMLSRAILVDDMLYKSVRELVGRLKSAVARTDFETAPDENWVPNLRNPEELFLFYAGDGDQLSSSSRIAAADDLACFRVDQGLDRKAFEQYIALEFLQKPLVASIDLLLATPQRFGAVTVLIRKRLPHIDPNTAWQTIMRWMRYYMPGRYALSIPNQSEVLFRLDVKSHVGPPSTSLRQLLLRLNTDKSRQGWTAASNFQAPHKPLLLLSLLKLIREGKVSGRIVEPSAPIESIFSSLASIVYPNELLGQMSLPFFHLETDGFWKLVPRKADSPIPQKARMSVSSLRTYVHHAELREDFYLALLDNECQHEATETILNQYFSKEVSARLRNWMQNAQSERLKEQ